jgi:tetratricopeptide (TPR) repeat protein
MFREDVPIAVREGTGRRAAWTLALALTLLLSSGCSIRKLAVNSLAGAFSGAGDAFASDEDPELVRDALPFALKTFETLLAESPENAGLLLSTCQGFTSFSYAFVEIEAEYVEIDDYREAERMRDRALKLYLRGRDYCLRALDVTHPGMREALLSEHPEALAPVGAEDVQLLYWTAASWGAAISVALDQPELLVDMATVRKIFRRCLELDPKWQRGTLYDAVLVLDALPETAGGSLERAREDFDKALELNGGHRVATYLNWARLVSLPNQDREEFDEMVAKALAVDPDEVEAERLANLVQQRYARFLQDQADDLFL